MSGGLGVLQLGRITSTKFLLSVTAFSQSSYAKTGRIKFPSVCVCFYRHVQTVTYEITNASYVPNSHTEQQRNKTMDRAPKKLENIGAFQKLPMVMPSVDILYSAIRKAKMVSPTKGIANIAKRERNRGAKQLDALMKELAVPLREYLEKFPKRKYLHPYERSLIELTLGDGNYEEVLKRVDALRKKVVSVGKEHASECSKSLTKREAGERLNKGLGNLEEIFKCEGKAVDDLLNIAKTLRAMPVVDLEMPTLCLVGAPNVGKSSLVRILSTGKPEVCNYPFTTRGILMGHIAFNFQHFQVTDTPGLLKRCDVCLAYTFAWGKKLRETMDEVSKHSREEDRNNLEKLTLAVLTHLPTAILYVHDLTGECGTSASDQFLIYKEIKERFSDHLWIDVVSKCDLLQESSMNSITEDSNGENFEIMRYLNMGPRGAIRVSVKSGEGLNELKVEVHDLLVAQMERIKEQRISCEATSVI